MGRSKPLTNWFKAWPYSVQIDTWLVDDYQKLGRFADAMALVNDLYAYDPLNPSFMALKIESTLQALRAESLCHRIKSKRLRPLLRACVT